MNSKTSDLFLDIIAFHPDRRRANHLLKVTAYALIIGEGEGMGPDELDRLRLAALLHDIGIKVSLDKYGNHDHANQQKEGPPVARGMLAKYGCPSETVERVCHIIAHHHEYADIDGLDYQAVVEADFLVNLDEKGSGVEAVRSVREKIFKTATGIRILDTLFGL